MSKQLCHQVFKLSVQFYLCLMRADCIPTLGYPTKIMSRASCHRLALAKEFKTALAVTLKSSCFLKINQHLQEICQIPLIFGWIPCDSLSDV